MSEYREDVVITGDASGLEASLSRASAKVTSTAAQWATQLTSAGHALDSAGKKMISVGRSATTYLTLPIAAAGVASVKMAKDFESAMRMIQTQAGGTAKDVGILSGQVLALARTAQQGPVQLADALFHLKSVGMDNVRAMQALTQSSNLAAVGQANLEDVTNALAGAWRSGIKGATNFHQAVGLLNAIIGAGNMRMADLIAAIGTGILPVAKNFGLALKDVGAALAVLTDNGMPANEAATRLRMTFALLGAPTNKAATQLKTIGLNTLDLAHAMRQPNGLLVALTLLKAHLERIKDPAERALLLTHAFGGGRSSTALLALINNLDVLGRKYGQISRTAGNFDQSVAAQAETMQARWHRMLASLQVDAVKLGDQLMPEIERIVAQIGKWADAFDRLSPHTKDLLVRIGLIAAAVGPASMLVGGLLRMASIPLRIAGSFAKLIGALGDFSSKKDVVAGNITGKFVPAANAGEGALSAMIPALAQVGAGFSVLALAGAGFTWMRDASIDVHKLGHELHLTNDQITLIQRQIRSGGGAGGKHSITGFVGSTGRGILGALPFIDSWNEVAAKGFKQLAAAGKTAYAELVKGGIPAAQAQEMVNNAMLSAANLIGQAGIGQKELNSAVEASVGITRTHAGAVTLDAYAVFKAGQAFISSDKAARLYGATMNQAIAYGQGHVAVTTQQVERMARLMQTLSNLGGRLTVSQQKWIAMDLASGQFGNALKIIDGAIARARKTQEGHNKTLDDTTAKFHSARDAAKDYDAKLRQLPKSVSTLVKANISGALSDIEKYRAVLYSLPSTIDTRLYVTPVPGRKHPVATGGILRGQAGFITRGPTYLVGEGSSTTFAGKGAEAVIPLDSRGIGILSEAFSRAMAKGGGGGRDMAPMKADIRVFLGDRQLERVVERVVVRLLTKAGG